MGCGGGVVGLGGAAVFPVFAEAFLAVVRFECGLAKEGAEGVEAGLCEDIRVVSSAEEVVT